MRKIAKKDGLGNFENASDSFEPTDEEKLWAADLMGDHSPIALIRGLWFTTSKPMGMKSFVSINEQQYLHVSEQSTMTDLSKYSLSQSVKQKHAVSFCFIILTFDPFHCYFFMMNIFVISIFLSL